MLGQRTDDGLALALHVSAPGEMRIWRAVPVGRHPGRHCTQYQGVQRRSMAAEFFLHRACGTLQLSRSSAAVRSEEEHLRAQQRRATVASSLEVAPAVWTC